MSWPAIRWAFGVLPFIRADENAAASPQRLVLLAYANEVRQVEVDQAWPGIEQLHKVTGLDAKTITKARASLIAKGLLIDTGQRKGSRGRTPVLRLSLSNPTENGATSDGDNREKRLDCRASMPPDFPPNPTENGARTDTKNGGKNLYIEPENLTGSAQGAVEPGERSDERNPKPQQPAPRSDEWTDPESDPPHPSHSTSRTREQLDAQEAYPERGSPEAIAKLDELASQFNFRKGQP